MRKQCVPGARPFFARARDEANFGNLQPTSPFTWYTCNVTQTVHTSREASYLESNHVEVVKISCEGLLKAFIQSKRRELLNTDHVRI